VMTRLPRQRILAAVSLLQLVTGLAGMAVALRRGHPYDVRIVRLRGRPDRIARDSLLLGTALSAPVVMMAAQGVLIGLVRGHAKTFAVPVLGGLGATLVAGYLGETLVRRRLSASGWDVVESPLLTVAIALASSMAALGLPAALARPAAR
jgi:hypothetical protein